MGHATGILCQRYSYGIYLAHIPLIYFAFVRGHGLPTWQQWGFFTCAIALVPIVAYHALEGPFITLGSKVAARIHSGRLQLTPEPTAATGLSRRIQADPVSSEQR